MKGGEGRALPHKYEYIWLVALVFIIIYLCCLGEHIGGIHLYYILTFPSYLTLHSFFMNDSHHGPQPLAAYAKNVKPFTCTLEIENRVYSIHPQVFSGSILTPLFRLFNNQSIKLAPLLKPVALSVHYILTISRTLNEVMENVLSATLMYGRVRLCESVTSVTTALTKAVVLSVVDRAFRMPTTARSALLKRRT